MNKCLGCGCETKRDSLCDRCFRIKNYNDYQKIDIDENKINDILSNIKKEDTVVLIVDLLNIPSNFDIINRSIKNDIILVLNKYDLMPTNNETKYQDYFNKYNLNIIKTFCISCKKNYNVDEFYNFICSNCSNKIYFIGYTNSGKSSLINKLIYNYSSFDTLITTSPLFNTTLDAIEIKINDITLIDTPGLINNQVNNLDSSILKKIAKSSKIKPITYQIKGKQYINIEDIIEIEVINNDITLYFPNSFDIERIYRENKMFGELKIVNYNIVSKSDIVLSGLGFLKVNKPGEIKLKIKEDIYCFVRDNLI